MNNTEIEPSLKVRKTKREINKNKEEYSII